MTFNKSNVHIGSTVICGDSNHPTKARKVIGYSSDSSGDGVMAECDCGVGFHSCGTRLFYFSEITSIVPDEPEWFPLTEENISKYLAVGDEVEVSWRDNISRGVVERISNNEVWACWETNGEKNSLATYLSCRIYKFRLINKAVREEVTMTAEDKIIVILPTPTEEGLEYTIKNNSSCEVTITQSITKPPQGRIKKYMSDISTKFKMLTLSSEDKLMVENGFKTVGGDYTDMFHREVEERETKRKKSERQTMYKSYEATIVAELKAIAEAEEKAK